MLNQNKMDDIQFKKASELKQQQSELERMIDHLDRLIATKHPLIKITGGSENKSKRSYPVYYTANPEYSKPILEKERLLRQAELDNVNHLLEAL